MAQPRPVQPVKLVVGLLGSDPDLLRRARGLLVKRHGPVDVESPPLPFDTTDYYADEMGGEPLERLWIGFERLIDPALLVDLKHETNALEALIGDDALRPDTQRPVNIDPGYCDLNKFVLASFKSAGHRLALGERVYAEISLHYSAHAWQPFAWTYPDLRTSEVQAFLTAARTAFHAQWRRMADAGEALP